MLERYFILGSGFGLYGYLPALIKLKKKVYLASKYKKIILKNNNIAKYIFKINFFNKLNYDNLDAIIVAKRPKDQFKFIKKLKNKIYLYLEKPLAENPELAYKLIQIIKKKKLKFNCGYLFFFTRWFKKLSSVNHDVDIIWNFTSKTFVPNNWKGINSKGGGIISFYGIHFIAILSYLKYNCISSSIVKLKNKKEIEWNAIFERNRNKINLKINIISKETFLIKTNKCNIYNSDTPFGRIYKRKKDDDFRVEFLKKYLIKKNFLTINENVKIIDLWRKIIKKTFIVNFNNK